MVLVKVPGGLHGPGVKGVEVLILGASVYEIIVPLYSCNSLGVPYKRMQQFFLEVVVALEGAFSVS